MSVFLCSFCFAPIASGEKSKMALVPTCPICYNFRRTTEEVDRAIGFQWHFFPDLADETAKSLDQLRKKFQKSIVDGKPSSARRLMPLELRFIELRMLAKVVDELHEDEIEEAQEETQEEMKKVLSAAEKNTISFHEARQKCYDIREDLRDHIRSILDGTDDCGLGDEEGGECGNCVMNGCEDAVDNHGESCDCSCHRDESDDDEEEEEN